MHAAALWLAHGGYVALLALHALLLLGLLIWRWRELRAIPWTPRAESVAAMPALGTIRWWVPALGLGLLVGCVAGVLRWSLPASPQVIYDEFWYLSTARHMREAGDATPHLERGLPPQVPPGVEFRPPYPQGWPWLEMTVAGGASWPRAVTLQRVVGVLACVAMFATFAAESLVAATFAGLGMAVLPAFLRLGQGASSEGASALFVILALWAARSQRWRPGPAGALLAVGAVVWAMHFRPENFLYLALFLPIAFVGAKGEGALRPRGAAILCLAAFVLIAGADFAIMADGAAGPHRDDHFVAQPRPGFATWQANMQANLRENALFFVDGRVLPRWVPLMALLGAWMVFKRRWYASLAFYGGWIALFTFALSPYPFGDFAAAHSADTWRFSIQVTLPLLQLGARGVEWAWHEAGRGGAVLPLGGLVLWMGLSVWGYWGFTTAPNPQGAIWSDLETVAGRVDGPVVVSDDSVAVALQEGFGVLAVADTKASPVTPAMLEGWTRPLWLLGVGDQEPDAWSALPLDVRWTTGPVASGREGLTLYAK